MRAALHRLAVTGIAALRSITVVEWGLLAVLVGLTHHYFWLMDDAFIYFRYVDNLLFLGRGLVFNQGEYVEGFTSPLWLLLLIPFRALEIDYWSIVHGLSLLFAGLSGGMLIWINRQLSPRGFVVNLPLAAFATHYGITSHFSSGLEAPLTQLAAVLFAALALRPRSHVLQVLVGITPLARPELALAGVVYGLWLLAVRRRVPWTLLSSAVLSGGAWLAFRIYYYASLLPNTFYLKDGTWWSQGADYLRNVVQTHGLHVIIPVIVVLGLRLRVQSRSAGGLRWPRTLMALTAAVVAVYVVRVGGDMLYFRLLAFPTCLGLLATGGVLEHAVARLPSTWPRRVIAGALGLGVAVWFFARYPEQLAGHPIDLEVDTRQWRKIADPMWHRQHHQLSPSPKRAAADRKLLDDYAQAPPSVRAHEEVLVHPWCRRALFSFDKYVVHSYGLTDAVLSRVQVPAARPGHKPLQRYAKDLARIRRRHDLRRAPGTFRAAVEAGHAPRWVRENLAALELLERKMYNRHDFGENLELALTPVPPIAVR